MGTMQAQCIPSKKGNKHKSIELNLFASFLQLKHCCKILFIQKTHRFNAEI